MCQCVPVCASVCHSVCDSRAMVRAMVLRDGARFISAVVRFVCQPQGLTARANYQLLLTFGSVPVCAIVWCRCVTMCASGPVAKL